QAGGGGWGELAPVQHAATARTPVARAAAADMRFSGIIGRPRPCASRGQGGVRTAFHKKTPRWAGFCVSPWVAPQVSATERATALARALGALLGFVHAQRPAVHLKAVQGLDRALRLGLRHVDETETTRLTGFPVVDELHRFHLAVTFKQGFHVLLGGVEREISHVNRRHPEVSLAKADSGGGRASVACTA